MLHESVKLKNYLCMGSQKFTNEYLGIHTDGLKCLNLWQLVAKIIEEYFSKSYLMLHEWLKVKKYLPLGSQKFTNIYLRIHTDGLKCLKLWQMVAKIIEEYFSKS